MTVRPVGLLYFGGALLTFGLWYAVTDRVIGRRIADWSTLIGFGLAIAFLIAFWSLAWRLFPRAWFGPLWYGLYAIIFCPQAIGWLTRKRRAGRLLLDLNQPRKKFLSSLRALGDAIAASEAFVMVSTEQVREQKIANAVPELGLYLKDWALQYGFGIDQVKAEVDRWVAEVEQKRDSIYELGLAAFASSAVRAFCSFDRFKDAVIRSSPSRFGTGFVRTLNRWRQMWHPDRVHPQAKLP